MVYIVNPRGGDWKIAQDIGEGIRRHPCLFRPSNPLTGFGGISVKTVVYIYFFGPRNHLNNNDRIHGKAL